MSVILRLREEYDPAAAGRKVSTGLRRVAPQAGKSATELHAKRASEIGHVIP
jgi:hypothetical protein